MRGQPQHEGERPALAGGVRQVAGPEHPAGAEPARGTVRLLLDRTVGPYFAAKVLASMGIWIHNVVAAIVVYQVSGSALLVGAVSIAQFTPQVFLAPWMGAVADRGDRCGQVVAGRLGTAAGSGALAVWIAVIGLEGPRGAAAVIAAALVVGIGFAVSGPAMHALEPALARPSELPVVITIATSPFTVARAAGPALGALLLVIAGPAVAFGVASSCQLAFAFVVWRLRLRSVVRPESSDGSVLAGVRYLRRDAAVALLLIGVTGVGFGVDPVITLSPPLAAGYGAGAELVAAMASAFGAGAAVTVFLLGPVRRRFSQSRIGSAGLGVLAASMAAVAASPTSALAVAFLFVGGMGMMGAITSLTTQIQQRVPEELRGRVMALWSVCFVGSRPLAAAINGAIADLWSPEAALVVLAALLAAAAILARPSRIARAALSPLHTWRP
ncbi:MAG: MFS transporter [Nitriliruptorales bacterium]|nr:MFS transporter [Nitriliruptorales bacterium]